MPYRARALEILEQWRAAERQHNAATDPVVRAWLQVEMEAYRDRYKAVVDEARRAQMPEPPGFPDPTPDRSTLDEST